MQIERRRSDIAIVDALFSEDDQAIIGRRFDRLSSRSKPLCRVGWAEPTSAPSTDT